MKLPITQAKGAELLPQKIRTEDLEVRTAQLKCEGFNSAVDQLKQCAIVLDEEQIENIIRKTYDNGFEITMYKDLAKAICAQPVMVVKIERI